MFVSPISMFATKNCVDGCSFGAHRHAIKKFSRYTRPGEAAKFIEQAQENVELAQKVAAAAIPVIAAGAIAKMKSDQDEAIKHYGITYYGVDGQMFSVATRKNGAFYKVKLDFELPQDYAKNFLGAELASNKSNYIAGLKNYMNCVNTIGRQDIIQKGLGIYEYEINTEIPPQDKVAAVRAINKTCDKDIKVEDLFFIGGEAHYFSPNERAIYSVNVSDPRLKQVVYKCNFISDDNGNTIGYEKKSWSIYARKFLDKTYIEQQQIAEKLPEYANESRNKEYAESLRFGNYHISHKNRDGVPKVLAHLHKFGFENATENDLQFVRARRNGYVEDFDYYLINYYNPLSGKSLTYDRNGRYLHQTDYIRDEQGQIISCSHE